MLLSLVVYCGLIFSFVSASSNNQTSNERININTALPTMSNLSSTVTSSSKPCTLKIKDSEISKIVELFNNDLVHVVDISVSLSNVSHGKELLSDFYVQLMNPIGREILFALNFSVFNDPILKGPSSTLRVGIRDFELHLLESQNGCIRNRTNATEFALETVQNIVRSINLSTNYDVWYSFKEISSGEERKSCCHITKLNMLECNDGCSENNSYLFRSRFVWDGLFIITFLVFLLCVGWIACDFGSHSDFDVEFPKYYKLEESRMSPSFIFFKLIWEENGHIISCIRYCVVSIGIMTYFTFYFQTSFMAIALFAFCLSGAVARVTFHFLSGESTTPSLMEFTKLKNRRIEVSLDLTYGFLKWCGDDAEDLRQEHKICQSSTMIKIVTSLFNIKFWRRASETTKEKIATFTAKHTKFNNRALMFFAVCLCYTFIVLCIFFSILFLPLTPLFLILFTFNRSMKPSDSKLKHLWRRLLDFSLIVADGLFPVFVMLIPWAIVSLLFGLFLNLIFFIPYLAFFSVLTFYCISYWKSMEENYLLLKQLIYEACRDTKHDDNDFKRNRLLKRNEKVLPVVSKELYDKIREKLLPYDENLFYLAVKLLCAYAFSFAIFQLIIMLREFEVTGFVQVLTTASLGVMPHLFNMATLKTSEQTKEAWKEKMKLNVKYMVEELVKIKNKKIQNSKRAMELVQTDVIMPWRESDELILSQGMELFQTWANEMTGDNDLVNEERVELLQTEVMIHQEHDTTNEMTDDNDQDNEERVELPQTEVMIHQEHDTTNEMTDENDSIFARFLKLFQIGRYFQLEIHRKNDTTNEITDDEDQVNEERVELPQTGVMIHQAYETRNEMTDDNDQVNEERVEPHQTEGMIHQEHDTTNEITDDFDDILARYRKLLQLGEHPEDNTRNEMTDNNDQVNKEYVEPPQTEVTIDQEYDTTNEMTDDNDQVNEERVELLQTEVMIHQEHDTTNEMRDENDGIFARFLKLFQIGRYFKLGTHRKNDTTNEITDDKDQVNEERVELLQTEVMIHQEHDTTNEMTDDNDLVNEERVELPQTEVMIHQEHDTTNEMTDENDSIFARFFKLFQIGRYFQLEIHRKNDTTNEITDDEDQVNEERVELPQTGVMIHQAYDTRNEMTDDNDQVNEERVEPHQTEGMIHQEHDTTNEITDDFDDILARYRKLLQLGEHPEDNTRNEMTDNNDQVNKEYVEPPQTEVTIDQEYDTTNEMTDDNDQVNEERVELLQTEVMIHQEHDTTNEMRDENDGIFARFLKLFQIGRYFKLGTHRKNDTTNEITDDKDQVNEERVELLQTEVMIHQEHDTTNEMRDENDGIFARFLKLFQIGRYFKLGTHRKNDTTNEITDDKDQVNEERVELLQTEVMIHQEHDTTNEMTDDNDQVNEGVQLLEMEVITREEHDTTNEITNANHGVFGRVFKIFRKRKK